ncbi:hypothetical protein EMPS_06855 [Entomortierella parvispora]|uniref:CBF1-interacting co-repressor CIR N-terminal domain-containing protein n=1 Tax=Entomortierella parvispora TaxID=205924 RepID=A0A9P3LXV7_9FUNG|nr:hypothetical protein EMPS_06855 [Entomortierella parvispora]
MNILPHKSWHVYNQKNRDKVRQDEAHAEAEQAKIDERAIAADREHRLNVLRERSRRRLANDIVDVDSSGKESGDGEGLQLYLAHGETQAAVPPPTKQEHINFWPELEDIDSKNLAPKLKEAPVDKKTEERRPQFPSTRLDQVVKGPSPWYNKLSSDVKTAPAKKDDHDYSKSRQDPLQTMKVMLKKKENAKRNRSPSPSSQRRSSHNLARKADADGTAPPKEMTKMDMLRKERKERELAERKKARALTNPTPSKAAVDDRRGAYNQQFNPAATKSAHSFSYRDRGSRYENGSGAANRTENGHSGDNNNSRYGSRDDRYSYHKDDRRMDGHRDQHDKDKDGSHRRNDNHGDDYRNRPSRDDGRSGRSHSDDRKRERSSASSRDRHDPDSRRR